MRRVRLFSTSKAMGLGLGAGAVAALLWPFHGAYGALRLPYLAALAIACACGMTILAATAADLVLRQRGRSVRPARAFDAAAGLLLAGPTLLALSGLLRDF